MANYKDFLALLWGKIKSKTKLILGVIIVLIASIGTIFALNNQQSTANPENKTEIAQIFEPSISTPLPPDVITTPPQNENPQNTTTPAPSPSPAPNPTQPQKTESLFIAPKSGIDFNSPITYSKINFHTTLPADSKISENQSSVIFTNSKNNTILTLDITPLGQDTLSTIISQLQTNPAITNIRAHSFMGYPAVLFSFNHHIGQAVIYQNSIYYIMGEQSVITASTIK